MDLEVVCGIAAAREMMRDLVHDACAPAALSECVDRAGALGRVDVQRAPLQRIHDQSQDRVHSQDEQRGEGRV